MYITNSPEVALIGERFGVQRIWIDLEKIGKQERQGNIDSVKSNHSMDDISKLRQILTTAELLVRVNPIHEDSEKEIDKVIELGADVIMLPMWKSVDEVKVFLNYVNGRVKTSLLLETKEAVECLDEVLEIGGFDEIHIGLNDLHLSYGMTFMFELLANGTVEFLCRKIATKGIAYGFGGMSKIGEGLLPAERILTEHYRLGSTRVILSRGFCNTEKIDDVQKIEELFSENMEKIHEKERSVASYTEEDFERNRKLVVKSVVEIVKVMKKR